MEDELRELKGVADEVEAELDAADQAALDAYDEATADGAGGSDGSADGAASAGTTAAANGGTPTALSDFGTADDDAGEDGDADAGGAGEDGGPDAGDEDSGNDTDTDAGDDASGVVATAESDPEEELAEIVVDQRELDSTIARDLSTREGVRTRLETLEVGDYVLSDRVAVERKSVDDFLDTLVGEDRSLFEQARALSRHYARPVVIVEGDDLYGARNIHPGAIRGALASLAVDYGMSVLRTEDEDDTAEMLSVVARREQERRDRSVSVHGKKSAKTLPEQQEYVVSAIADIGPVTARSLLSAFGSVEGVMTARQEDLLEVDGVGEVTAERVREVVGSDYGATTDVDAGDGDGDA
jgi:Fanconi anemia group M protein